MTTFISNRVPNDPSPDPDSDPDPDPDLTLTLPLTLTLTLTPTLTLTLTIPPTRYSSGPDHTPNQVLKRVCTLLTKKEKNFTVTGNETGL